MAALSAPWPGAVGVSGGGDSLALMFLLADWAKSEGKPEPVVLTVDHGLRPDSKKEAERVEKVAASVGLTTHILVWKAGTRTMNPTYPQPVIDRASSPVARCSAPRSRARS